MNFYATFTTAGGTISGKNIEADSLADAVRISARYAPTLAGSGGITTVRPACSKCGLIVDNGRPLIAGVRLCAGCEIGGWDAGAH